MTCQLLQGQGLALLPTWHEAGLRRVVLCLPEVLVSLAWPGIMVPPSEGICFRPGGQGARGQNLGYRLHADVKVLCDLGQVPIPLWASVAHV